MCIIYSVYLAMFFFSVENKFGSSFYSSKKNLFPIFVQNYRVHLINLLKLKHIFYSVYFCHLLYCLFFSQTYLTLYGKLVQWPREGGSLGSGLGCRRRSTLGFSLLFSLGNWQEQKSAKTKFIPFSMIPLPSSIHCTCTTVPLRAAPLVPPILALLSTSLAMTPEP